MRLVIGALYYVGNVMVLAEKDFALDLQSGYRIVKMLLLFFIVLPPIFSAKKSFAADWTPCEAPCNDVYTTIDTPSPASGSTHPIGNTVTFTVDVARDGASSSGTFIPFQPEVSTSGGTGWSATLISPSQHCIYGTFAQTSCTNDLIYPIKFASWLNSPNVSVEIDVTIGTGTTRVTVRLANALGVSYISPVFYFDVSASGGVRVTGLTDMSGTWNGSGDAANNDNVCIYSSDGTYDVLVEGTVDAGSYVIAEGGGTKIPIAVYWNNTTGTSGRTVLDQADAPSLTAVTGGDTSSQTCSGGNVANISWKALEADLQAKPAGTYTATMTVTATAP